MSGLFCSICRKPITKKDMQNDNYVYISTKGNCHKECVSDKYGN